MVQTIINHIGTGFYHLFMLMTEGLRDGANGSVLSTLLL